MTYIACPGFCPAHSDQGEEQLLLSNLPLLVENTHRIISTLEFYACQPVSSWASFAYVGGGPLCIGHLLEGFASGCLRLHCPHCDGPLFVVRLGGSPLSGANFMTGACLSCTLVSTVRHVPGFLSIVIFVLDLQMSAPMSSHRWAFYPEQEFTWGGMGLKPVTKRRLEVVPKYNAVTIRELVSRLQSSEW